VFHPQQPAHKATAARPSQKPVRPQTSSIVIHCHPLSSIVIQVNSVIETQQRLGSLLSLASLFCQFDLSRLLQNQNLGGIRFH
jgi:hypothetical protein